LFKEYAGVNGKRIPAIQKKAVKVMYRKQTK
jgi:hypothetical protein